MWTAIPNLIHLCVYYFRPSPCWQLGVDLIFGIPLSVLAFLMEADLRQPRREPPSAASRIAALTAVVVALGGLIAAAKPIYETLAPAICKMAPASMCEPVSVATPDQPLGIAVGTTGWMYV